MVDYSKLPGGKAAISNMHKSFPDVKFTFHPHDNICTLEGGYSKVHALTKSLLGHSDSQKPQDFQPFDTAASGDQKAHSDSEQMEGPWQTEFSELACGLDLSKHAHRASERNLSPTQIISTNGSKDDETLDEGTSQDDFSMVIDSDIFHYIQKHCSEESRSILDLHGVEVMDVSTDDITTLYLQLKADAVGRGRGDIWLAHVELGWLYQEKEAQLRKEQLPKEAFLMKGFQNALEVLKQTFPKLLINEDKANIYLVGSGSDLSEAKQFLKDINGATKEHNQVKKPHTKTLFLPSGAASLSFVPDVHVDAQFREEWFKGGNKSNIAAKFEGGVSTERSISSLDDKKPSQDEHTGTYPPLSEKHLGENVIPKDRKLQGEDILFKEPVPIPKHNRKPLATLAPSHSIKNTANRVEIQSNSLDTIDLSRHNGKEFPTALGSQSKSGHTRANSFSGPVRPKQGHDEKISKEDLPLITNEGSHLKHNLHPDSWEVLSVEVKVPLFQWLYMKQFHLNEIEDITSDLKMTETQTRTNVTLLLRGADAANVGVSQERLKELIAKIAKEFTTTELSLASVGVLDSKSETVERQCRAAREKFERVQIIPVLNNIFFLGPKLDCLEAMSALKEWFLDGTRGRKSPERGYPDMTTSSSSTDYGLRLLSTDSSSGNEDKSGNVTALRDSDHLPPDQPQYLKYKQDRETDTIHRRKDGSLKNDANSSEGMHDDATQNSDRQIYEVEEQKTPKTSDLSERKSLRENGSRSAPLSDNDTNRKLSVNTSEKSLPSSVLSSETNSPTGIADPQNSCHGEGTDKSTQNKDKVFIKDNPAFLEEHGDIKLTSTTSSGTDVCPWCKDKVNPYCSICPKSETADPQTASNKHYEGNGFEGEPEDQIEKSSLFCVCGISGQSVSMMACGVALCPPCQEKSHSICSVCYKSEETVPGIRGTMTCSEMSFSLPGHNKDTTLKLSYTIPDGIQGVRCYILF